MCNITDILSCGNGQCILTGGYPICNCDTYYNIESNCTKLVFEEYKKVDIILSVLMVIFEISLTVLISLELILNVKFGKLKINWKNTLSLVKIILLCSLFFGIVRHSLEITQSITGTLIHKVVIPSLLLMNQLLITGMYIFSVVNWITLILKVKNMSYKIKGLPTVRKIIWTIIIVWIRIIIIIHVKWVIIWVVTIVITK